MQSFCDLKVIKKLIVDGHNFYDLHNKTAEFSYEFHHEVGWNN